MTSSKDPLTARPVSGSFSKSAHYTSSRPHSHSISLSAANASHRVSRRKSVNASASASTAHAAIAAALREHGDGSAISIGGHRRSLGSRRSEAHSMSARPSMHNYFRPTSMSEAKEEDAVEDNSGEDDSAQKNGKSRNRRASEGSHLIKGEAKKSADLRCDTCGKGYKHSSCLTKHMWEHDPAWAITSKLLISKHQQVQLLEAASVLCNISTETASGSAAEVVDAPQPEPSDTSSASPGYSAYSEMQDEPSSVETTPPPLSESAYPIPDNNKRYSTSSTGLGRSYRSVPSSSFAESAVSPGLPPHQLSGVSDFRPTTSGTDDGMLAAAAAGLNFAGTPRSRPVTMAADIPPVPPLPTQYQSHSSKVSESTLTHIYSPFGGLQSHPFNQQLSDERSRRETSDERRLEEMHDAEDDEDEGMFKMEE